MPKVYWFARLQPGANPGEYEQWVREVDYPAARQLPSILDYSVYRVQGPATGNSPGPIDCDYFEVATVTSMEDYFRDIAQHPAVKVIVAQIGRYIRPAGNAWGFPVNWGEASRGRRKVQSPITAPLRHRGKRP